MQHTKPLRRYFDLLVFRVFADLKSEASKTYLGILWWIFEPLFFLLILNFVFGHLRGGNREGFAPFLFSGLVIWQWIRSTIGHCTDAIRNNLHMLRQVRLPPTLFPLIVVATDTVKFAIVLVLLLVLLPFMGGGYGWQALFLPLVLLPTLVFIVGAGLLVASITPLVPDIRSVVDTVLTAAMFVSGVFFRVENIPPNYRWVMDINPVAQSINAARSLLLEHAAPDFLALGYVALVGLIFGALGLWIIGRLSPLYTKQAI